MEENPNITLGNSLKKTSNIEKEVKYAPNPAIKIPKTQTKKFPLPFKFGVEVAKLKISIPLIELIKDETYKSQIRKSLNFVENEDSVDLIDHHAELIFSPDVNGKSVEGGIPPFYTSFNIHYKILHNVMLDFGASHNVMPKSVMEKLNLDITRPYNDLSSFDSSQVPRTNKRLVCFPSTIPC